MAKEDKVSVPSPTNGGMASPSLDDVLESAKTGSDVGGGVSGRDPRGSKAGVPRGAYKKDKGGGPPSPAVESFITWDVSTVAMLGDAPFNLAYAGLGPEHDHWEDARKKAQATYPMLAKALNDLGVRHPKYLALTLGLSGYVMALGQASAKSWQINRAKRTEAAQGELHAV